MKKAKITFLMLAFNSEKFIRRTIESVRKQTEPDIRLVIRNNASTDGTDKIIRQYMKKDSRISCVQNQKPFVTDDGVMYYERGWWPQFQSEYISIIDHDDILDPEFAEKMYKKAKEAEADLVVSGCLFFQAETLRAVGAREIVPFQVNSRRELTPYFPYVYPAFRTLWGKLIRTEIYERYYEEVCEEPEDLCLSRDTWRMFGYLDHCDKIAGISEPLYYYQISEHSQFRSNIKEGRIGDADILYEKAMGFLEKYEMDTAENREYLRKVHWGHMYDIFICLRQSKVMAKVDKISYMQEVFKNRRLGTYLKEHFGEIAGSGFQFVGEILTEEDLKSPEYSQFWLVRLYQSYLRSRERKQNAFFLLLSAVLDEGNIHFFGREFLSDPYYLGTDGEEAFGNLTWQEQGELLEGDRRELIDILAGRIPEQTIHEMEDALSEAAENGKLDVAAVRLEELAEVFPEDEYVGYYRMYLSALIGETEHARELAYAAQAVYPYEENICELCREILKEI